MLFAGVPSQEALPQDLRDRLRLATEQQTAAGVAGLQTDAGLGVKVLASVATDNFSGDRSNARPPSTETLTVVFDVR